MIENEITKKIISAAIEVHKVLGGPGLLEKIYEDALFQEFLFRKIPAARQVLVPIKYKGVEIREPLRLDLLVDNSIIIEIKSTEVDYPVHRAQLLTYLRLTNLKLGLLLNFGHERLVDGIRRVVNGV